MNCLCFKVKKQKACRVIEPVKPRAIGFQAQLDPGTQKESSGQTCSVKAGLSLNDLLALLSVLMMTVETGQAGPSLLPHKEGFSENEEEHGGENSECKSRVIKRRAARAG